MNECFCSDVMDGRFDVGGERKVQISQLQLVVSKKTRRRRNHLMFFQFLFTSLNQLGKYALSTLWSMEVIF